MRYGIQLINSVIHLQKISTRWEAWELLHPRTVRKRISNDFKDYSLSTFLQWIHCQCWWLPLCNATCFVFWTTTTIEPHKTATLITQGPLTKETLHKTATFDKKLSTTAKWENWGQEKTLRPFVLLATNSSIPNTCREIISSIKAAVLILSRKEKENRPKVKIIEAKAALERPLFVLEERTTALNVHATEWESHELKIMFEATAKHRKADWIIGLMYNKKFS